MHSWEENNNVIKDSESSVYHLYFTLPVVTVFELY